MSLHQSFQLASVRPPASAGSTVRSALDKALPTSLKQTPPYNLPYFKILSGYFKIHGSVAPPGFCLSTCPHYSVPCLHPLLDGKIELQTISVDIWSWISSLNCHSRERNLIKVKLHLRNNWPEIALFQRAFWRHCSQKARNKVDLLYISDAFPATTKYSMDIEMWYTRASFR